MIWKYIRIRKIRKEVEREGKYLESIPYEERESIINDAAQVRADNLYMQTCYPCKHRTEDCDPMSCGWM